jgi:hypothetical protein
VGAGNFVGAFTLAGLEVEVLVWRAVLFHAGVHACARYGVVHLTVSARGSVRRAHAGTRVVVKNLTL